MHFTEKCINNLDQADYRKHIFFYEKYKCFRAVICVRGAISCSRRTQVYQYHLAVIHTVDWLQSETLS